MYIGDGGYLNWFVENDCVNLWLKVIFYVRGWEDEGLFVVVEISGENVKQN